MTMYRVIPVCIIFVLLNTFCSSSKYSEQANADTDNPFRMMKVNMIWHKAKLRIKEKNILSSLYQDLKYQDQMESDLKHKKAMSEDEDGEYEAIVRRKFLDLVLKYGLEGVHPDVPTVKTNEAFDTKERPDVQAKWEKVLLDKKLGKLWKKAQLSGFTEKELGALRSELLHHMDKVDELEILKSDLYSDGLKDNNVASLKDPTNDATLQQERDKHIDMKRRYKELRDNIEQLEDKIRNEKTLDESAAAGFRHPKVIDLWFNAKNSNFTSKELESIREELQHFEHKLKKLETLEQEHDMIAERAKDKNKQLGQHPEKHLKVQQKMQDYGKKVKKYEHEIKSRIDRGTSHNEL